MAKQGKQKKNHIVVFQDDSGNVIKTAFVTHGQKADPPEVPEKNGESAHHEFLFDGWDQDLSHITDNTVAHPVYRKTPKKYLVMYFHEDGRVLGTETVTYQESASAPYHPEKEGNEEFYYVHTGWNCDLTSIREDTMAKAVFEKRRHTFRVEFLHEDGSLLSRQEIGYGYGAVEPEPPLKEADETFHYYFDGWDETFDRIVAPKEIRATFREEYNEYRIRFFEEEEEAGQVTLHYGDPIPYPSLYRKGYTLSWDPEPARVEGDAELRATYSFSNPKGKIVENDRYVCEILNPSVSDGSVRLIRVLKGEDLRILQVPDRIRLGDYYYRTEEIGPEAFASCHNLRKLTLPNTVRHIQKRGLARCGRVRVIEIGKGLSSFGGKFLEGNRHLRKVLIRSPRIRQIDRNAFAGISSATEIAVLRSVYERTAFGNSSLNVTIL